MHFHANKHETFYILEGKLKVETLNTETTEKTEKTNTENSVNENNDQETVATPAN